MKKNQLLQYLKNSRCLDLVEIQHAHSDQQIHSLIDEIQRLKEELKLSTRISPQITEVESLMEALKITDINVSNLLGILQQLDLNQRANKISRFILAKDNHLEFAKPADLVMFGDSITEWGPWHDALPEINLSNRGLAGDTTSDMLQRVETTSACRPKLVCIMAGINDLAQVCTIDCIVNNYSELIKYWKSQNINVWVQSTLFVGDRISHLNPLVKLLNGFLQDLCRQLETRYIDLASLLCPGEHLSSIYSCDDLHLNSIAYKRWLTVLSPDLLNHLRRC